MFICQRFPGSGKVIDFPRLGKSDRSEHRIPCSFVVDFPWDKFLSQAGGWGWGFVPLQIDRSSVEKWTLDRAIWNGTKNLPQAGGWGKYEFVRVANF